MNIRITKMHGAGNDYVYVNESDIPSDADWSRLSVRMSDRHFGVGSDGLVVVGSSDEENTVRMHIFNADGSEAEMCGNAARCVGLYALENGWWKCSDKPLTLYAKAGIRYLQLKHRDAQAHKAELSVTMGKAEGRVLGREQFAYLDQHVLEQCRAIYSVEVGNPHCVLLFEKGNRHNLLEYGARIENDTAVFANRTNVEFVEVIDRHHVSMSVWERGSGPTLACGTGATASAFAAERAGLCDFPVEVGMPGGKVVVDRREDGELILCGDAERVFDGEYIYFP